MGEDFMNMVNACVEKAKQQNMFACLYDEDRYGVSAYGQGSSLMVI